MPLFAAKSVALTSQHIVPPASHPLIYASTRPNLFFCVLKLAHNLILVLDVSASWWASHNPVDRIAQLILLDSHPSPKSPFYQLPACRLYLCTRPPHFTIGAASWAAKPHLLSYFLQCFIFSTSLHAPLRTPFTHTQLYLVIFLFEHCFN